MSDKEEKIAKMGYEQTTKEEKIKWKPLQIPLPYATCYLPLKKI